MGTPHTHTCNGPVRTLTRRCHMGTPHTHTCNGHVRTLTRRCRVGTPHTHTCKCPVRTLTRRCHVGTPHTHRTHTHTIPLAEMIIWISTKLSSNSKRPRDHEREDAQPNKWRWLLSAITFLPLQTAFYTSQEAVLLFFKRVHTLQIMYACMQITPLCFVWQRHLPSGRRSWASETVDIHDEMKRPFAGFQMFCDLWDDMSVTFLVAFAPQGVCLL